MLVEMPTKGKLTCLTLESDPDIQWVTVRAARPTGGQAHLRFIETQLNSLSNGFCGKAKQLAHLFGHQNGLCLPEQIIAPVAQLFAIPLE